jgi:hypothetical protein
MPFERENSSQAVGGLVGFWPPFSGSSPCFNFGAQNGRNALQPTKTALKRLFQGHELVAGTGFENVTFRL